MQEVMQQQENAQRMTEMVGVLIDLYSMQEAREISRNEHSIAAIETYIGISEPDVAVKDLRRRLAQAELDKERLKEELHEKKYCRRCEVRDDARRRRMEKHCDD
jgi:hypothetical protein